MRFPHQVSAVVSPSALHRRFRAFGSIRPSLECAVCNQNKLYCPSTNTDQAAVGDVTCTCASHNPHCHTKSLKATGEVASTDGLGQNGAADAGG